MGEELTARRNANKASGNQRVAARTFSPAGGIGAVSDSRLKAYGAVNEGAPSTDPISKWLLAGGGLVLLGGLAWGATFSGQSSAPALASAPRLAQARTATTPSARAATPEQIKPPVLDELATAQRGPAFGLARATRRAVT